MSTKNRDEYDRYWANERHGPPALRPFGPHHRQNTARPPLTALADEAAKHGMTLALRASETCHHKDTPLARRDLMALSIQLDTKDISGISAGHGGTLNLEAAAAALLEQLEQAA